MRSATIASLLAAAATASAAGTTPKAENNPEGAHYQVVFDYVDQTGVWGSFDMKTSNDGKSVDFEYKFNGVAKSNGGPFTFHIHQNLLEGRNCSTTGGHFDPYGAGTANCKSDSPGQCEVGDLSGRYRKIDIESNTFEESYSDQYVSLDPNNKAFVGDKSFVIHNANTTRVACGNFVKKSGNSTSTPSNSTAAPTTIGNPAGVVYRAQIDWLDQNGIDGFFEVKSGKDGKGTDLNFTFNGLTGANAPYAYHIHEKAVSNRDCNSTGGHLNPYKAPATCDQSKKELCEVGDLSGKYGKVNATKLEEAFADLYLSTNKDNKAFVGDKSIVIHDKDNKRVACASFVGSLVAENGTTSPLPEGGIGGPTNSGNSSAPGSGAPAPSPNAGSKLMSGAGALFMAAAAAVILL